MFRQAKLSNYFTQQGRDVKKDGKRKLEETSEQTQLKKNRVEKKKITSFFVPKPKKALCNESQDVIIQKEQTKPDIAPNGVEKAVKSTKDNSSAVTAWSTMFNKAALVAPLCAGHSEACVRRKVLKVVETFFNNIKNSQVNKKGPNTGREFWCCARGEGRYFSFDKNPFFWKQLCISPREGDPLARCNFFKWVKS